ncbi:unnamed protein product, partial [Discosporangium mesarthrocarpum]
MRIQTWKGGVTLRRRGWRRRRRRRGQVTTGARLVLVNKEAALFRRAMEVTWTTSWTKMSLTVSWSQRKRTRIRGGGGRMSLSATAAAVV